MAIDDDTAMTLADRRALIVLRGRRALLAKLLDTGFATADDVRAAVALPPGIAPQCLAAVPRELVKARIIMLAYRVPSARREAALTYRARRLPPPRPTSLLHRTTKRL